MSDIAFQCPKCGQNMAVSDQYVGLVFSCPKCQTAVKTPVPVTVFPCPACSNILFADGILRGRSYGCPDCETPLVVPEYPTVQCAVCGIHVEMDEDCFRDVQGTTVDCPQCAAKLDIPAIPKPAIPAAPEPPKPGTVVIQCRQCPGRVELDAKTAAQRPGKLMRCPKCRAFLMVPRITKTRTEEPEIRTVQPAKVADTEHEDFSKTMRLDDIVETIPLAEHIQHGECPYCNLPLRQLDERSYVCERCSRVVRVVRHR
jgi:hypothetical protein